MRTEEKAHKARRPAHGTVHAIQAGVPRANSTQPKAASRTGESKRTSACNLARARCAYSIVNTPVDNDRLPWQCEVEETRHGVARVKGQVRTHARRLVGGQRPAAVAQKMRYKLYYKKTPERDKRTNGVNRTDNRTADVTNRTFFCQPFVFRCSTDADGDAAAPAAVTARRLRSDTAPGGRR